MLLKSFDRRGWTKHYGVCTWHITVACNRAAFFFTWIEYAIGNLFFLQCCILCSKYDCKMVEQSRLLNVSRMYCSVHEGYLLWWSHVTRVQNNLFNDGGFHFSEIIWHKLLTVLPRFTLKKQSKSQQFHNQNLGCKKLKIAPNLPKRQATKTDTRDRYTYILFIAHKSRYYINHNSKIQLVVYHQCCVLIGWATTRLYVIVH